MSDKTVNYTPEQTTAIVQQYVDGIAIETLAEQFGKSVRSIVAKLSREGVYKKKEYVTKSSNPAVKKDTFADNIAALCGFTEAETESLTKANKTALIKILQKLQ